VRDWLGEAKAKQVYMVLRDRILSGAIACGDRLPTENELAETHGVSRVTVRRALGELARERLIARRRSAGTHVIYRPAQAPMVADISGLLASLADMGRQTSVQLLSFDHVPATGPVAEQLGASAGELLQRAVRVRSAEGVPFSYLVTHVPDRVSATFTRQDLAARPLLELIERAGIAVDQARQRVSAALATPEVAKALGVHTGSPLIELVRVVYDRAGRGVEHLHALYRPDRYAFEIDLVRSRKGTSKAWSVRSRDTAANLQPTRAQAGRKARPAQAGPMS
jgi:GntR family transcriptional regulator